MLQELWTIVCFMAVTAAITNSLAQGRQEVEKLRSAIELLRESNRILEGQLETLEMAIKATRDEFLSFTGRGGPDER